MTVRRATTSDIGAIVDLRVAFLDGEAHLQDEAGLRSAVTDYLQRAMPLEACVCWVGESDGRVVGTGVMTIYERMSWDGVSKEGYILNMYTEPEHRGKGIGTQIVEQMQAYAKQNELRLCLIATDVGRPIYERAGFEPDPRYLRWR